MTHRPARPARLSHPLAARRFKPLPLAVAAALVVSSASAQQAPKSDDGKVETVIITATKRLQPLQETPIAVSVLGGAALEEGNLDRKSVV